MREPDALGTAGGLYYFRDTILAPVDNGRNTEDIEAFFVMNGDVCADFPLDEMLDMHFNSHHQKSQHQLNQQVLITVMATETTRQQSVHYGMFNLVCRLFITIFTIFLNCIFFYRLIFFTLCSIMV